MKYIQYIGKKPLKTSRGILPRDHAWHGHGAVVAVDDKDAAAYLEFTDAFRDVTDAVAKKDIAAVNETQPTDLFDPTKGDPVVALKAIDRLRAENAELKVKAEEAQAAAQAATERADAAEADAAALRDRCAALEAKVADGAGADRRAQVMVAIGKLDPENAKHFKDGKPTVKAVSAAFGKPVTATEVKDAWEALVAEAEKTQGAPAAAA